MGILRGIKRFVTVILVLFILIGGTRFIVLPSVFQRPYTELVSAYAQKYQLPESLVYGVMYAESKFDPNALSNRGAKGLMQVMDETGEWAAGKIGLVGFTPEMLYEPEINIQIGCWYLRQLTDQFEEPLETILAAYNAGNGNVQKWLSDQAYSDDGKTLKEIPFEQTKKYVKKVVMVKKIYETLWSTDSFNLLDLKNIFMDLRMVFKDYTGI